MAIAAIAAQVVLPMILEQVQGGDGEEKPDGSKGDAAANPLQALLGGITGPTGGNIHK